MSAMRIAHIATIDLTVRFLLLGQLRRLRDEGYDVTAICAPGPWIAGIEDEGITHIPWTNATRSWNPVADARAFAELVGILRRERFDLVHTHNPKPGLMGRIGARFQSPRPVVINTVHGLYATPDDPLRKRLPVLALEWLAARCSDLELYQSGEDLAWARRIRLVRRGRSVLLGNGTDLTAFDPGALPVGERDRIRRELDIAPDALVVGTVGRMVEEKGYRELFEAARFVRSRIPDARFLVVGEPDPSRGDAVLESDLARASEDVVFAGWRSDVPSLLSAMDVFVLPSWREGMPRAAIEAAAMGLPLVLTDIRGCREVARPSIEALAVPVRDPGRLAEAIMRLARDPELRAQMGQAARVRALERFDEQRVADVLVQRYSALLTARRPPVRVGTWGVRAAQRGDADVLARLHRTALPASFLPVLGQPFLRRLYRALAVDPEAVTLVMQCDDRIVGFVAGVTSVRRFYRRFVLSHGVGAVIAALPALRRPEVRRRLRETAGYPTTAAGFDRALPEAELLSIAVDPRWRRHGVASSLTERLLDSLGRRGVDRVRVVVGSDNAAGNSLYQRAGFVPAGRITVHDGTESRLWVAKCGSS